MKIIYRTLIILVVAVAVAGAGWGISQIGGSSDVAGGQAQFAERQAPPDGFTGGDRPQGDFGGGDHDGGGGFSMNGLAEVGRSLLNVLGVMVLGAVILRGWKWLLTLIRRQRATPAPIS